MVIGKMGPAQLDHLLVDVNHDDALDRPVLQRLSYGRALSATRDKDGSGAGVRDHGGMDKSLVVGELIDLGRLRLAVQHKAHSKGGPILHDHVLVLSSA